MTQIKRSSSSTNSMESVGVQTHFDISSFGGGGGGGGYS